MHAVSVRLQHLASLHVKHCLARFTPWCVSHQWPISLLISSSGLVTVPARIPVAYKRSRDVDMWAVLGKLSLPPRLPNPTGAEGWQRLELLGVINELLDILAAAEWAAAVEAPRDFGWCRWLSSVGCRPARGLLPLPCSCWCSLSRPGCELIEKGTGQ